LRSKWAAGKARRRSISESIGDPAAAGPPAHFHRNPLGCVAFGRLLCRSSVKDHFPLRFAHPAKIRSNATTPVTDLVH
jgi:hypothetical protein